MAKSEDEAKKAYAEAGVDLPELEQDKPEEKAEEKSEPEPKEKTEAPKSDPEGTNDKKEPEGEAPLKDEPKEQRKRSIYDDYRDKKAEVKSEKEAREKLERENAELRQKLEAAGKAETPEEKKEAADDLEEFAKAHDLDPAAMRRMRDLFLKDVKPGTDPALAEGLKEFQAWRTQNSKAIEAVAFEKEFTAATPKLKQLFPTASPEEMTAIKTELDRISHSKDWHDKSLPYIAFEHQETLSALISPKKRGLEGHDRKHDDAADSYEFDPNADISKMSVKEYERWEAEYQKMTKPTGGLMTGANGKKTL